MPQFFFDITDGVFTPDFVGTQLSDIASARVHAIALSGDLLNGHTDRFWGGEEWMIEAKDDCGLVLFTLVFRARDTPVSRRSDPRSTQSASRFAVVAATSRSNGGPKG